MSKKLHYFLLLFASLCIQGMVAQGNPVTGTVTDDLGSPLPGVNVVEKGTNNGTSTDFDGKYTIDVANTATLVFSSLGFTTKEVAVSGKSTINVTLEEDAEQLGEVVVTALGIKREAKAIGYAMTEVQGEELARLNVVNPVQSLQGKSPGVSIGASDGGMFGSSKIQIRGISTLNSNNNQPIFVIDGVILENATSNASADWNASSNDYGNILKNLNPDDYKTVSVLKGAAATALYGSRGINGVVLITTKDGSGSRGLGVSVKQSVGFDIVYKGPALQNEYGPGALAGYINYGDKDGSDNYYNWDTEQFFYNNDGVATLRNHPWGWAGFGPRFDGRPIEDYDGTMITYDPQKSNMLDAYTTGINTNTSVALSGGNEHGNFYLSDSYTDRTGTLPNNSFKRNSLLFRGSYNLSEWLRASASISFTNSNSHNPRNDISQSFFDGTFGRAYNTKKYMQNKYWQASHGGVPNANYGDEYTDVPNRGLWFAYENNNSYNKETVVRPIVTLAADVTDWLTITAEGNMNHYTTDFENKELGAGFANEGGYYELKHAKDVSKTGKLTFNLKKEFTNDLSANLLLGGEIWEQEKSFTRGWTDGGLIVPGKFYLGNSLRTQKGEGRVYATKQLNSAYFLGSLAYKNQLFLDITGRNDWSSALVYTDGTGNNSYFYPSVSGSWIFSETTETSNWFTFGKVRASWAQVGSDTSPYSINRGYGQGSIDNGGNFVYTNTVNTTLVDRSIKPELKDSYEIGADVRFFNNRLGFDVAYYSETISEQIGNVPLPSESGYSSLLTNIGTLTNSGVELMITGTPVKAKDFSWNSTFNYWNNTTKIDEVHPDFGEYKSLGGSISYGNFRVGSVAFEGGEYGVLYSDSAPKKFQSSDPNHPNNGKNQLIWVDSRRGAYFERSGEAEKVGKIQPDFEGSWNNEFNIGNFNMSILLDARFGGHMASYSSRYGTAYGFLETSLYGRSPEHGGVTWTSNYDDVNGKQFSDGIIPDGVFAEGQTVTTPSGSTVDVGGMTYQEAFDAGHVEPTHASYYHYRLNSWGNGVINDNWFAEVKYIALRNISMGYNLPKMAANKMGARNVYLGLNARNVAYLYNSMPNNINPESFRGTTSTESFLERSFSPYMASYTFSIAIDF